MISFGEEQHGLGCSLGCLEKPWSTEIFSNAAQDAPVGIRQFLHYPTVLAAAAARIHILHGRIQETAAAAGARRRLPRLALSSVAILLFPPAAAAADSESVKNVLIMVTVDLEVNRIGIM